MLTVHGADCALLALGLAVLWNFEARGLRQGAITGRAAVVVLHLQNSGAGHRASGPVSWAMP